MLLLSLALACGQTGDPAPAGADAIAAADLRAIVTHLASDAMLGREALGPGGEQAARWLSEQVTALGLEPLPGHEVLVPFTVYPQGPTPTDMAVTLELDEPLELAPGVDARPFPFSTPGEVQGPVVFAGYGIHAPDQGWDDYEGLDVRGRIVLVLRHHPHEGDPMGPLGAETPHAAFRAKAEAARAHGAVGMLVVTDPKHHAGPEDLRLFRGLSLDAPTTEAADQATDEPFLAFQVSRSVAERLVGGEGLLAAQEAIDRGERLTQPLQASARLKLLRGTTPSYTAHNVVAIVPGVTDEQIVVAAHYDHLGSFSGAGDTVYNGADDNASGTAAALELAQAFATLPEPPRRTVVFAFFSAEEHGLLGSRAALRDEVLDPQRTVFMLNLEMIGRNPDQPVQVVGDGFATGLAELVQQAAGDLPLRLTGEAYVGNGDHDPFFQADVPFLQLTTGLHEDYHQLGDHADKLEVDRMAAIVRASFHILLPIAQGEVTPHFVHNVDWLGVRVQLTEEQARVVTVRPNTRAERAGIREGDVIVGIGGEPLQDPRQLGARFRALQPGAVTRLGLERGGNPIEALIERAPTGFLGILTGLPGEGVRERFGLGHAQGVLVRRVLKDSPAQRAGLEPGDILYRIAGYPVGMGNLDQQLASIGAGEIVRIEVIRPVSAARPRLQLDLVLGTRPEEE